MQALDPIYRRLLPAAAGAGPDQDRPGDRGARSIPIPGQTFAGKITAINPQVDASSRNVQVRATLGNPDRRLLPGMYATIDIDVGAPQRTSRCRRRRSPIIRMAARSTWSSSKGAAAARREQTFVTTGATRGDQVAVLSGVKEGDVVVTAGQMKLHNGSPVTINNNVQPTSTPRRQPADH